MASLAELEVAIRKELAGRAPDWGLDPTRLEVTFVLNWGGFGNQSFTVGDGRTRVHLKLTADTDSRAKLATWHRIHADLTASYRAPAVLDWVTITATGHEGLLFRHLPGTPAARWDRRLREGLLPVLQRLHSDRTLRARAYPATAPISCAAGYVDDFHQRFVADLAFVGAGPPDFVGAPLLTWLGDEVARLAEAVAGSASFGVAVDALIHGDLWPNNVLVTPNDDWWLVDWDDCRVGDPALDLAKLLDDGVGESDPPFAAAIAAEVGEAARERIGWYRRAIGLDWVIDPLADYLDADQAPGLRAQVQARKEREHREALARYRAAFGGS